MSLNGINTNTTSSVYQTKVEQQTAAKTKTTKAAEDTAVVYEKSASASEIKGSYGNAKTNSAIVDQLKADAEARKASLFDLVNKTLSKQSSTFQIAISENADNIWNEIRQGNFKADAQTIAQAKEDISEDGYWGVKKTAERLVDFAKAISGGDASKIDELTEAIKKGFKQAEKLWGGELPEISQKTYDKVMEDMQAWKDEAAASGVTA